MIKRLLHVLGFKQRPVIVTFYGELFPVLKTRVRRD
jgi:hypothetical protein